MAFQQLIRGLLLAWCGLSASVVVAATTVFPGADWKEVAPEAQGVDAAKLKAAVDYFDDALRDYGGGQTITIIRNGYLIWKGADTDKPYQIQSCTKSFTSTCLGLLIDDGKLSLNALAKDYAPELANLYPAVTFRHFATMTSGYDAHGGNYEADAKGRMDGGNTPFTPAPPLFPPGTKFRYWDKAFMEFGKLLTTAAGEPLDSLFKRRIADPIGMKNWQWWQYGELTYGPSNRPALHWTGGLYMSARELARFGLLFLNRGNWKGKQLISASWVDAATTVQVPDTVPNDSLPRSRGSGTYGYNWWVNGVRPNGKRTWPDVPPRSFYASGLHAQVCIVIPEWNMVIARTNGPGKHPDRNSPSNIDGVWNTFLSKVGEALEAPPAARHTTPSRTEVSIRGDVFYINGRPTYSGRWWQGRKIEGLLFNSRMVQGIFDDLNRETRQQWAYPDTKRWDPERNTREYVAAMADWRRHGLLGFTINLQGGNPHGYAPRQPWVNSAITKTGDLRPDYMARLERILDRADELGMVAILGIFYFGQDQVLANDDAVNRAVDNTVRWVLDHGYRNVLIEISNECNEPTYDRDILRPAHQSELIDRVKGSTRDGRRLLVSTSYTGGVIPEASIVRSADFLLLHGNAVEASAGIAEMVRKTRAVAGYRPMPIVFNEDDHYDFDKPQNNMLTALGEYASWGYYDQGEGKYADGYQTPPVNWGITGQRNRAFFGKVKEITGE